MFAPLPLLGLDFGVRFTPKWSMSSKISVIGGSYENISAVILQTSINARYKITNHVGVLMGITYFNAVVSIDEEKDLTDIAYGYHGLFIGMFAGF